MVLFFAFFFFKQKTAYEMRISDWSSDVCSSDLIQIGFYPADHILAERALQPLSAHFPVAAMHDQLRDHAVVMGRNHAAAVEMRIDPHPDAARREIGRASCRARGCPYV